MENWKKHHFKSYFKQNMQLTYLAWWEDKEEGQVGTSHCIQTDRSQLLALSQDATLRELADL